MMRMNKGVPMKDNDTILEQSFELFQKILSNKGRLDLNRKINRKIHRLHRDFGFDSKEVLGSLVEVYLIKKLHEKYQAEKALSTFILHIINYTLNALIRKCDIQHHRHNHISLEKILKDGCGNLDEVSLDFLERLGAEGLVEFTTPEDLIIGKQLLELMIEHYGIEDVMVLLGFEDRHAAAERLNMAYDSYCKRLMRKTLLFLPVLEKAGYLIP
jgi:hypothetical protein